MRQGSEPGARRCHGACTGRRRRRPGAGRRPSPHGPRRSGRSRRRPSAGTPIHSSAASPVVAEAGIFLQCLADDRLHVGRDAGCVAPDGLGLPIEDAVRDVGHRLAGNRQAPGEHLAQHDTERGHLRLAHEPRAPRDPRRAPRRDTSGQHAGPGACLPRGTPAPCRRRRGGRPRGTGGWTLPEGLRRQARLDRSARPPRTCPATVRTCGSRLEHP